MNDRVDLGNHRRLREPLIQNDVAGRSGIGIKIRADIHQRPYWQLAESIDQSLQRPCIAASKRTETYVNDWLVGIVGKTRQRVRLLRAHASFEVLEARGVQRLAAIEFYRLGIEQQIQKRRRFEKLASGYAASP